MTEVILYAAIATIVCAMLYSVLGKNVGQGPESGFDPQKIFEKQAESDRQDKDKNEPEDETLHPGVRKIRSADPDFSPQSFLDGAKGAYSMILEGFADGDRDQLRDLLTPSVFEAYESAIADREEKNLTQVTDLARLSNAEIVDAELNGKSARISVKYQAELSSVLMDEDGQVIEGNSDTLSKVSEIWTFDRELKSKDPNWRLSDVASSSGDSLEADPSPDTKD